MTALSGMKSICEYVDRSAPTVLKWVREQAFPAGRLCGGVWESDTKWIDKWKARQIVRQCEKANARW